MLSTVKEAAKVLRLTEQTVRVLCQTGRLPTCRIGKKWLIDIGKVIDGNAQNQATT